MLMRKTYCIIFLAVAIVHSISAADYNTIATRAARFFSYKEWASAGAMYTLMIDSRPEVSSTYGHAIVAAGMLDKEDEQIDLTHRAMRAQVPVDSIFKSVEQVSFSLGQTSLYERYLLLVQEREQWLVRVIDGYLLRYYTYRNDGSGMVIYARKMLTGLPDDEQFLYTLAQGNLLVGNMEEAIATYERIVEVYPQSYEALLYLGNYYAECNATKAIDYLHRAQAIRRTPVVDAKLAELTKAK